MLKLTLVIMKALDAKRVYGTKLEPLWSLTELMSIAETLQLLFGQC